MGSRNDPPSPPSRDPDALMRPAHVIELTGMGRTTLWRRVRDGDFPRPVKISARAVAWPRRVVTDWIASRPTA